MISYILTLIDIATTRYKIIEFQITEINQRNEFNIFRKKYM